MSVEDEIDPGVGFQKIPPNFKGRKGHRIKLANQKEDAEALGQFLGPFILFNTFEF